MNQRVFDPKDFDKIVEETCENLKKLAAVKGGEYAADDDRLANFRRNAEALGLQMEQVWAVYAGKHWDAVRNFVKDLGEGRQRPASEPIEGRVDDLIVYLTLFKAILQERRANNESPQLGVDTAVRADRWNWPPIERIGAPLKT